MFVLKFDMLHFTPAIVLIASPPLPPPPVGSMGDGHFGIHGTRGYEGSGYGEAMHSYEHLHLSREVESEASWIPSNFIEKGRLLDNICYIKLFVRMLCICDWTMVGYVFL